MAVHVCTCVGGRTVYTGVEVRGKCWMFSSLTLHPIWGTESLTEPGVDQLANWLAANPSDPPVFTSLLSWTSRHVPPHTAAYTAKDPNSSPCACAVST